MTELIMTELIMTGLLPTDTKFEQDRRVYSTMGGAPAITCNGKRPWIEETEMAIQAGRIVHGYEGRGRVYENTSPALRASSSNAGNMKVIVSDTDGRIYVDGKPCRIRRLTPREYFRLQGVRDEDYDKVAQNQSNSALYHLAGDSICVDVLMAIFGEMLD